MREIAVCITFDVDLIDHTILGVGVDELTAAFPILWSILQRHPDWRATWFVRLDEQMESLFGCSDHLFQRNRVELSTLREAGHEIGWHPHCYVHRDGRWVQNSNVSSVLKELTRCAVIALSHGLRSVRVGWGFHTNETMSLLAHHGFKVDSSAIPRPRYRWDQAERDWTVTPPFPYNPSVADYRVPGKPQLPILELPMSVIHIEATGDTDRVLRYLNPAFHNGLYAEPLERWLAKHSHLVTVTHPYEIMPKAGHHPVLAFDAKALEQNLALIGLIAVKQHLTVSYITVSEFADRYLAR